MEQRNTFINPSISDLVTNLGFELIHADQIMEPLKPFLADGWIVDPDIIGMVCKQFAFGETLAYLDEYGMYNVNFYTPTPHSKSYATMHETSEEAIEYVKQVDMLFKDNYGQISICHPKRSNT